MTTLVQIAEAQAGQGAVANENFKTVAPAALFAQKYTTTTGLTLGYYGGYMWVDGALTSISDGTVSLAASSTNYVEASRSGTVSSNTTGFTAGKIPLYTAVTGSSSITTLTDYRRTNFKQTGRLVKSLSDANYTLTAAEATNDIIEFTGTLTANRDVIFPSETQQWTLFNNTSGGFSLVCKVSGQTGVTIASTKRAIVYSDGTDVVRATADQ